jgi:hypothetical protein
VRFEGSNVFCSLIRRAVLKFFGIVFLGSLMYPYVFEVWSSLWHCKWINLLVFFSIFLSFLSSALLFVPYIVSQFLLLGINQSVFDDKVD